MSDKQIVERVRARLYGSSVEGATTPPAQHRAVPASPASEEAPPPATVEIVIPDKALEVLTLAQRTAEAHLAEADDQAHKARAEAQIDAEQIHRGARRHAEEIRAEAESVLTAARAAAARSSREAAAQAAEIRRQAELALADARAESERIVAGGRSQAEQLELQAQQRYEDAVGGLAIKREALQEQIEALEVFDTDYRQQLSNFVQKQLRVLWAEHPEGPPAASPPVGEPVSSRHG